jgi:hypothetical protein
MPDKIVREFRHIVISPLQLRRLKRGSKFTTHWDALGANPGPWREVRDNLLAEDDSAQLGYREFVYFLPYVQRFLYGFGEAENPMMRSSLHIFTRSDIAKVRITLRAGCKPIDFDVHRVRLTFFYDVDIALFALEIGANDLPLADAVETMDRFGRPYPPYWVGDEQGAHCTNEVQFIGRDGELIAASDYNDREKYVSLVRDIKQTPLSIHWEHLLQPMVPAYLGGGVIQYYQIENKRFPIMSYLAFDDPHKLTRGDFTRIGFTAKWGDSETLPYAEKFLANFEEKHCYDRYWDPSSLEMNTRYTFCGVAFAMITKRNDERTDLLSSFRHQFFQIGTIANFHKGALLNLSNRFSVAVELLKVGDYESVREFKRNVREALELFLRFNHRYWFHEISNQVQAHDIFRRWSHQLGSDELYAEVREEAQDINQYLDAERTRKASDNAMRLTVVSACGMVGTVATGFLGMNLYSHADLPTTDKILIFLAVFVPISLLGLYTVIISKRLATFMEALSSERLEWGEKLSAFRQIWRPPPKAGVARRPEPDPPKKRSGRSHRGSAEAAD